MKILRNYKVSVLLSLIILMGALGWAAIANPFKATDPNNPNFDPMKFRFEDYITGDPLRDVFREIFPVGTDKSFVDKILVGSGGATSSQSKNAEEIWRYTEPRSIRHSISPGFHLFIFDSQNKLLNIQVNGGERLYPNQISSKELHQNLKNKILSKQENKNGG